MPRYNGGNAKVPMIEKIIQGTLGVEAEYEPQFDRLKVRTDDRAQSRIDKNFAPRAMVERYANQMGEFEFPPIVLTADGVKVDGNTRVEAHAKRGDRYIPALVVPVKWFGADPEMQRKLLHISQLLNNMNGLPLDDAERRNMATTMMEGGSSDVEIVGRVGLALNKVRDLRERFKGMQRLKQVGITDLSGLDGVMRAFGKPNAENLDDKTFHDIAQLAIEAGLKTTEINSLATSLTQQGSPEMRQERLARERQAREPQIEARKSGQSFPYLAGKLNNSLQILFAYPQQAFMEHDPEKAAEYLETLAKAIEILGNICTAHGAIAAAAVAVAEARPQ
jgi:hypothetical protein